MTFDVDGLTHLVADLNRASVTAGAAAHKVVTKGALNIKKDWQQRASGLAHAPLYPASITYETRIKGGAVEALIGPDKSRPQGALGNLITYGSVNNPPTGDDIAVIEAEAPRFVDAMRDVSGL